MTHPDDEGWRIEDFGCFLGCSAAAYERLRSLLDDPANDDRPFGELMVAAWRHGGEHLDAILTPEGLAHRDALGFGDEETIACEQPGFFRMVLNPVPMEVVQRDDAVVLRYEWWAVERTVYMDGRGHPADAPPSLYGHSIGRYEESTLLVETVGVLPSRFWTDHGGGGHSDRLRAVERYARSADGDWLRLEVTFEDAVMLREPLVYERVWRLTPDIEFLEHDCETISGQR